MQLLYIRYQSNQQDKFIQNDIIASTIIAWNWCTSTFASKTLISIARLVGLLLDFA